LDRYSIDIEPGTFGAAPNTKFIISTFTSDDGFFPVLNRQQTWLWPLRSI